MQPFLINYQLLQIIFTIYFNQIKNTYLFIVIILLLFNYKTFQNIYNCNQHLMKQEQFDNNDKDASYVVSEVRRIIQKTNNQIDLFTKAFLKPVEIALKTWRTQGITDPEYSDSLPFGLKHVYKQKISNNTFELLNFQPFNISGNEYEQVRKLKLDNMISLLKPSDRHNKIKVCICICMYSEDKTALRKTLAGVSRNIQTFAKNGISSDQIIVAVLQDGIQKVDPSVVDFMGELQQEGGLFLEDDCKSLDVEQILKPSYKTGHEKTNNVNKFIYDSDQFADRKQRRFASRRKQFEDCKKLSKDIQNLEKKKNVTISDLDKTLIRVFIDRAKQVLKKKDVQLQFLKYFNKQYQKAASTGQIEVTGLQTVDYTENEILQYYDSNPKLCRPLINDTLRRAKQDCLKYVQTRQDLALLNCFRIDFSVGAFIDRIDPDDTESEIARMTNDQSRPEFKTNLMFITKYKNAGKLSSHNWFFNGLCKEIQTQFAVLLDVGLCPDQLALYKMCEHMEDNVDCGGVCGYMNLRMEKLQEQDQNFVDKLDCMSQMMMKFVDIQRVQQVEYHFAHLIDKPFQALFKFIHVLPGAYSAYRMAAFKPRIRQEEEGSSLRVSSIIKQNLENLPEKDSKLLREYFKSLEQSTDRKLVKTQLTVIKTIFKVILPDFIFYTFSPRPDSLSEQQLLYNSNVYFAEDRTLCLGIHQNGYTLDYLPDAYAWVDPIKNMQGLLGQRKRWINGSFFAFQAVKTTLLYETEGQCTLKMQILYYTLMNMLSFVAPAFFLFAVHTSMYVIRDWFFGLIIQQYTNPTSFQTNQFYNAFVYVMDILFIMLMMGLVFKSMHFTHKDQKFYPYVYALSTIFGILSVVVFVILIVDMVQGIIDSVKCFSAGDIYCSITYLVDSPLLRQRFFNQLPGGITIFFIYKWMIVANIFLYFVPLLIYWVVFCKFQFLIEIIFGVFAFVFYTPTYVNILTTFALCRIDDISWGTKGLDAGNSRGKQLMQKWKAIKIIQVAKYVFWNVIVGAGLVILSSPIYYQSSVLEIVREGKTDAQIQQMILKKQQFQNTVLIEAYIRRFYVALVFMGIIFLTFFVRIILGAIYTFIYRCKKLCASRNRQGRRTQILKESLKVENSFEKIKQSMKKQVDQYAEILFKQFKNSRNQNIVNGFNLITNVFSKVLNKGKISFRKLKQQQFAQRNPNLGLPPKKGQPIMNKQPENIFEKMLGFPKKADQIKNPTRKPTLLNPITISAPKKLKVEQKVTHNDNEGEDQSSTIVLNPLNPRNFLVSPEKDI